MQNCHKTTTVIVQMYPQDPFQKAMALPSLSGSCQIWYFELWKFYYTLKCLFTSQNHYNAYAPPLKKFVTLIAWVMSGMSFPHNLFHVLQIPTHSHAYQSAVYWASKFAHVGELVWVYVYVAVYGGGGDSWTVVYILYVFVFEFEIKVRESSICCQSWFGSCVSKSLLVYSVYFQNTMVIITFIHHI